MKCWFIPIICHFIVLQELLRFIKISTISSWVDPAIFTHLVDSSKVLLEFCIWSFILHVYVNYFVIGECNLIWATPRCLHFLLWPHYVQRNDCWVCLFIAFLLSIHLSEVYTSRPESAHMTSLFLLSIPAIEKHFWNVKQIPINFEVGIMHLALS